MRNDGLQRLREKLIAERNSGSLSREDMDAKREQLIQIKGILEGRGVKYPASL
jgi:hypothetical protein